MTSEEIENMPAGREMDVSVAEEVLGWRRTILSVRDLEQQALVIGTENLQGTEWKIWEKPDGEQEYEIYIPHYSTDILAAWEVVEKLHNDFSISLDYDDPQTIEEIKWCCELYAKNEPYKDYEVRADTAPLAICRAARLAMNKEV